MASPERVCPERRSSRREFETSSRRTPARSETYPSALRSQAESRSLRRRGSRRPRRRPVRRPRLRSSAARPRARRRSAVAARHRLAGHPGAEDASAGFPSTRSAISRSRRSKSIAPISAAKRARDEPSSSPHQRRRWACPWRSKRSSNTGSGDISCHTPVQQKQLRESPGPSTQRSIQNVT